MDPPRVGCWNRNSQLSGPPGAGEVRLASSSYTMDIGNSSSARSKSWQLTILHHVNPGTLHGANHQLGRFWWSVRGEGVVEVGGAVVVGVASVLVVEGVGCVLGVGGGGESAIQSAPRGNHRRVWRLWFSTWPRCRGEWGSQNHTSRS